MHSDMCFELNLIPVCGCFDESSAPSPSSIVKVCKGPADLACLNAFSNNFTANKQAKNCDCPVPCNRTVFDQTVTLSNYPSKAYADYLISDTSFSTRFPNSTDLTFDLVKSRIALIKIFYNQMSETLITEKPKLTIFLVVSQVGGIVALMLGN